MSAYVIRTQPYRETSLLLTLFTSSGLLSAIAKGARSAKDPRKGLLQPFSPLMIQLAGRSELKALSKVEPRGTPSTLKGLHLFAGFHLNEILLKCLKHTDGSIALFEAYEQALIHLSTNSAWVRYFELTCLQTLGMAASLNKCVEGAALKPEAAYIYREGEGFQAVLANTRGAISGGLITRLGAHQLLSDDEHDARRLLLIMLSPLLEGKTLASRQMATSIVQWQKGEAS